MEEEKEEEVEEEEEMKMWTKGGRELCNGREESGDLWLSEEIALLIFSSRDGAVSGTPGPLCFQDLHSKFSNRP